MPRGLGRSPATDTAAGGGGGGDSGGGYTRK